MPDARHWWWVPDTRPPTLSSIWSALADEAPGTEAIWATRSTNLMRVFGGGIEDQLPARGELGADLKELVESGRLVLVAGIADHGVTRKQRPLRRRRHGRRSTKPRPCRSDHRRDRTTAGSRSHTRIETRARSMAGISASARSAHRSQSAFLRISAASWTPRTRASGTRLLHGRHQELRPSPDFPVAHRLRTSPFRRRGDRRRHGVGRRRAARASGNRGVFHESDCRSRHRVRPVAAVPRRSKPMPVALPMSRRRTPARAGCGCKEAA